VNVVMVRAPRRLVFHVRRVLSQWIEGEVTWNSGFGIAWQSPGAKARRMLHPIRVFVEILSFGGYDFPSTRRSLRCPGLGEQPAGNFGWMLESEEN